MTTAVFSSPIDQGPFPLQHFNPIGELGLIKIGHGAWAIWGKCVISNVDGDPQNASAALEVLSSKQVLDKSDLRIPGDATGQSFNLQGVFQVNGDVEHIQIVCSTFNGQVHQIQLMAISVDLLLPSKH